MFDNLLGNCYLGLGIGIGIGVKELECKKPLPVCFQLCLLMGDRQVSDNLATS